MIPNKVPRPRLQSPSDHTHPDSRASQSSQG